MPLDIFQQAFSLAILADLIIDKQGTLEELQKSYYDDLTSNLKNLEGWNLAWGPTIWKLKPDEKTYPGNAGYIAFHQKALFEDGSVHPTYVIAIAGTPMNSTHVIDKEDNAVDSVVDFNAWVRDGIQKEPVTVSSKDVSPGTSYFSKGMAWGTHNLMNAVSFKDHSVSPGMTMVQFLSSLNPSPSTRFIITGHSLGGTLTTTISLTLVTAEILPRGYTITYPAAACSAGNVDWAHQFAETFPSCKLPGAHSYQGWNLNLVNNLDSIPQLWCQMVDISPRQWLGRIPSLYGIPILDALWKKYVVEYATKASSSGVVYKPIPSQYFNASPPTSVPTTVEGFSKEAMVQHTTSYMKEVGIHDRTLDAAIALTFSITDGSQEATDNPEDQKGYDHIAQEQSFHAVLV
ncbi:hypothetical protein JVU11DRAFT_11786 [Chiua virens]|nr:hypothetical protein JVU11DRAFT_11786 [Chiua virens]